jgi:hypothetical protein
MADTVTRRIIEDQGRRAVVRAEITSDGTGTTDGILADISALAVGPDGTASSKFAIERIDYVIDGMQVVVEFDATTDDFIATLAGTGTIDFTQDGKYQGYIDPASSGTTGDIVGTTVGHTAGDKATIILYLRKKD